MKISGTPVGSQSGLGECNDSKLLDSLSAQMLGEQVVPGGQEGKHQISKRNGKPKAGSLIQSI